MYTPRKPWKRVQLQYGLTEVEMSTPQLHWMAVSSVTLGTSTTSIRVELKGNCTQLGSIKSWFYSWTTRFSIECWWTVACWVGPGWMAGLRSTLSCDWFTINFNPMQCNSNLQGKLYYVSIFLNIKQSSLQWPGQSSSPICTTLGFYNYMGYSFAIPRC